MGGVLVLAHGAGERLHLGNALPHRLQRLAVLLQRRRRILPHLPPKPLKNLEGGGVR